METKMVVKDIGIVANTNPVEFVRTVKEDIDGYQMYGHTVEVLYSYSANVFTALLIVRDLA